jgi:hypothetical protein
MPRAMVTEKSIPIFPKTILNQRWITPKWQNMRYAPPILASLFALAVHNSAFAVPEVSIVTGVLPPMQISYLDTEPIFSNTFTQDGSTITGQHLDATGGIGVFGLTDITLNQGMTGMLFSDVLFGGGVLNIFYGQARGPLREITFDQGDWQVDLGHVFDISFNEPVKHLEIEGGTTILGFTRQSVPDGGGTLTLLGLGLLGVVFCGRIVNRGTKAAS